MHSKYLNELGERPLYGLIDKDHSLRRGCLALSGCPNPLNIFFASPIFCEHTGLYKSYAMTPLWYNSEGFPVFKLYGTRALYVLYGINTVLYVVIESDIWIGPTLNTMHFGIQPPLLATHYPHTHIHLQGWEAGPRPQQVFEWIRGKAIVWLDWQKTFS